MDELTPNQLYYLKHKERMRKYYEENKQRIREKQKAYYEQKVQKTPTDKFSVIFRGPCIVKFE